MIKQYIFIDESGDLGLSTKLGASKVFVMSAVSFSDRISAILAIQKVKELKLRLLLKDNFEFKYHRTDKKHKEKFLLATLGLDCKLFCLVVRKSKESKRMSYSDYLVHLVKVMLENSPLAPEYISIIVDGSTSSRHLTNIKRLIKDKIYNLKIDIRYSNSKNDELVQMADMVSGLVFEFETKGESRISTVGKDFYNKIRRFYLDL